jgi:hypothetical protein
MFDFMVQLASHIVPFLAVMGQVVTIWGFLNFINQLNLQNLTLVADRALGRLPGLKHAIFVLKTSNDNDIDVSLDRVSEITKRLNMDLKQLGIAQNYAMKQRVSLLSQQVEDQLELKHNYLRFELGDHWNFQYKTSANMVIPWMQTLENDLLNIFDLSHAGQTFVTHVATNVIRVGWFSLVIYLIECDQFNLSGYLFCAGILIFSVNRWMINNKN